MQKLIVALSIAAVAGVGAAVPFSSSVPTTPPLQRSVSAPQQPNQPPSGGSIQQGAGAYALVGYTDNFAPGAMANLPLSADTTPDSWSGLAVRGAPFSSDGCGRIVPSPKNGRARFYLARSGFVSGGVLTTELWTLEVTDNGYVAPSPPIAVYGAESPVPWDRRTPLRMRLVSQANFAGCPAAVTVQ